MMKATGITAEFDPLHNGHAYLIDEARRQTGCDAVVIAMSGDYVQRGEPALTDKWTRTEAALGSGADLVIEIPVLFCLGNASQYARASVRLLEASGCGRIAFGSESGDISLIERTACCIRDMGSDLSREIKALAREGLSYPAARSRAYAALRRGAAPAEEIEAELSVLERPNDILALEYVTEMHDAAPLAVKRRGAPHSGSSAGSGAHQSASFIRQCLREDRGSVSLCGDVLRGCMPDSSLQALRGSALTFTDDWTTVLRFAVMSSSPELIEDCPSGGEGLGHLLRDAVHKADSFEDIITSVKSKRYTYTRISRLCMQTLLGITRTAYPYLSPAYIRVLGFSSRGRRLLSEIKRSGSCSLPVITNINREAQLLGDDAKRLLELDVHASDIYNLVTGRDGVPDSDHVRCPVITEDALI